MKKSLEEIAAEDGRFDPRALRFVFEGLSKTIEKIRQQQDETDDAVPRHISGRELALGLADVALNKWGRLAAMVLEYWGVKNTHDMGEIVYLMIRNDWMTSQDSDRIEDFDDIYDFGKVFAENYVFAMR